MKQKKREGGHTLPRVLTSYFPKGKSIIINVKGNQEGEYPLLVNVIIYYWKIYK